MSQINKEEDDDLKMPTLPNSTAKTRNKNNNIRPKPLAKKIAMTDKSSNKSKKILKRKKMKKSEATIRRRKRKKLKQKLKEICEIKQIYNTDKSLLSKQQLDKMKQEKTIESQLESMNMTQYKYEKNENNNRNKSLSHARRINEELLFISQQINTYSSQLNNYISTNNIRTIETYIGNIKNSLLTLYSRMSTLMTELDSMQYIPLRYTDNPNKPSIYFKNEFINHKKPIHNYKSHHLLSNQEIEKRALKKRKELKLKTHIFDNYEFFTNRFESFGISHRNILKMMASDGRMNAHIFGKFARNLISKHAWDNNELFFNIIQGIVPHSKVFSVNLDNYLNVNQKGGGVTEGFYRIQNTKILHKMLYNMQCAEWIGNQLEKLSLLVHNGWQLDCTYNKTNIIAWSQLLWTVNFDQYYYRIICFIHDFNNGKINFVDQHGRSLAHFAVSIFPVNMAYKLCVEMNKIGYNFGLQDVDAITPVTIFYCNMLKTYKNSKNISKMQEFKEISGLIIQWSLDACEISRGLPIEIVNTIVEFGHYDIQSIKNKNWQLQNLFINKWVYASIHENYWKLMLKKQKKRLHKMRHKNRLKTEKNEKKLKLKNEKIQNRINEEKKRLYLLQHKNENIDIEMDEKWKDFEIPIEKQKEFQERDLKNLMIKAKKNKKRNARKKRKKQIKSKIKMENEIEILNEENKKELLKQLLNENGISKIVPIKSDKIKSFKNYNNTDVLINNEDDFKNDYINNYKMSDNLEIKENYHENVLWYLNYDKIKRKSKRAKRGGKSGRGPYNNNKYQTKKQTNVALNRGNRVTLSRPLWIGRYENNQEAKQNDCQ